MPSSSPAFKFDILTRSNLLVASWRSATNALRGMTRIKREYCLWNVCSWGNRKNWNRVLRKLSDGEEWMRIVVLPWEMKSQINGKWCVKET